MHGSAVGTRERSGGRNTVENEIVKLKIILILRDTCINYNSIGYYCMIFLKYPWKMLS